MIYLIGSLRNPEVPLIANYLRAQGYDIFDDWYAAGPDADDEWKLYETRRGRTYREALLGLAAKHVFSFDKDHLQRASDVVLVLPAGKSGHLELGWAVGQGKRGYILLDNPDRWDVMYQFATAVVETVEELSSVLSNSVDIRANRVLPNVRDSGDGEDHPKEVLGGSLIVEGSVNPHRGEFSVSSDMVCRRTMAAFHEPYYV